MPDHYDISLIWYHVLYPRMSYWWALSIFEGIPHSLELLLNYRLAWKPCVLT